MEGIEHKMVAVNGINMHIAEKGEGPVVLLVHGFPELWYTWKHQILGLASSGYRAVAPDLRGYGDTDAPPSFHTYTTLHIAGDLIALLDALGLDQVFVVGHDWGANIAWSLCLYRPDRVKALVNLSIAFVPRNPSNRPTERLRAAYGDDYYMIRFQEPGVMEAEFGRFGAATVLKKLLTSSDPMIPKDIGLWISPDDTPITLPSWLSEEDIDYYASKFEEKGFTGGFNYYRSLDLNWEVTAAWTGAQVKVPVKFIVGDMDLSYNNNNKAYINGGGFKKDVPLLEEVVVMEGVGHFINLEKPDEINKHICDFFQKYF